MTITDVARAAGVSIAVVSYALNDRPGVSDSTRRHVLRVADDLGWRPNAAARSMRSAVAASVGLQTLDPGRCTLSRSVALELAGGLRPRLGATALAVEVVADRTAGAAALEAAWTERRHAAFVLHDLLLDDPRMRAAARVGAPVVAVTPPGVGTAGVTAPVWFAGQAEAAVGRYLTDLGHRRFALVVEDARTDVARALHEGILDATTGRHATVEVVEVSGAPEAGAAAARLLARDDRPTALVTDGDVSALAVLGSARHRGFRVPWEVSVVAGSDAETCRLVEPQLTAVSRPWRSLAPVVDAALDRVRGVGEDGRDPGPTPPTARLVIRGTTAPPPSSGGA
ncbi:LacI family transcriptional regulator [Isoptericola jiangsuensis]|uniref:LacI family transcriptional regulator n=1 Tax=Isoptericola jiangsuensis TaxID=548579 RepID=A0A2A9EVX1_9MICO|nr:LacI family transcriptional regulator [Isoptericola jiangsuensis]